MEQLACVNVGLGVQDSTLYQTCMYKDFLKCNYVSVYQGRFLPNTRGLSSWVVGQRLGLVTNVVSLLTKTMVGTDSGKNLPYCILSSCNAE